MLVPSELVFAWFVGATSAARWVRLICFSWFVIARPTKPKLFFVIDPLALARPFKAASATRRVLTPLAAEVPLIFGVRIRQLQFFLCRWSKNHWIITSSRSVFQNFSLESLGWNLKMGH